MKCKNILIVRLDAMDKMDTEVKDVAELLREKYRDRNLNTINYSVGSEGPWFEAEVGMDKWNPMKGDHNVYDTGVYVVQHGGGGSSGRGFKGYLAEEATRKGFAKWLLSLAGEPKSLKIRKLCFLACMAVEIDKPPLGKAVAVGAATAPQADVFVQQVCHAISEIDAKQVFDGLMVAGYLAGVSIVKVASGDANGPDRIFKAPRRSAPDKPMHPAQDSANHAWSLPEKIRDKREFEKTITTYIDRKRIFVLEKGRWRVGKISEYSDKDEQWTEKWRKLLEQKERDSKLFL